MNKLEKEDKDKKLGKLGKISTKKNYKMMRSGLKKNFSQRNRTVKKTERENYDIDSLMSAKDKKLLRNKKPTFHLIIRGTADERRRRIGLENY